MKNGKKVKAVQETECKKGLPVCSKEENLKKLANSGKLEDFVRKNKGCWDHQSWLVLCGEVVEEGYEPIDFDQVGLILESHKTK